MRLSADDIGEYQVIVRLMPAANGCIELRETILPLDVRVPALHTSYLVPRSVIEDARLDIIAGELHRRLVLLDEMAQKPETWKGDQ